MAAASTSSSRATGVIDEQQLLTLFEDGVNLAQGPHIGRPGPVRPDLSWSAPTGRPALRRVETKAWSRERLV